MYCGTAAGISAAWPAPQRWPEPRPCGAPGRAVSPRPEANAKHYTERALGR
jgi:hypothetical protein